MSGPLQWTPAGMVPPREVIGSGAPVVAAVRNAHDDDDDDDEDEDVVPQRSLSAPQPQPQPRVTTKPSAVRTPCDVVKAARARLREIRAELRHMKKLSREAAELERLLDAAKTKPRAVVRELPKRSAG